MAIHRPKPHQFSFHSQLEEVCKLFPRLKVIRTHQGNYLAGTIEIFDETGDIFDEFQIEIHNSQKYPYRFPKLYEVGEKIPHSQEWHVYVTDSGPKKSCCITVKPIETITCKNGISVIKFINTEVLPYLYKQAYRLRYGYYPGKEFGHGLHGLWEYYGELFETTNREETLKHISLYGKKLHKKSHCYCGSDRKFRLCHPDTYHSLKTIPKEMLIDHINKLSANNKIF